MLSLLPRSTLRPCSWCARQRYVGASRICSSSVSMARPLKVCAMRLAPSVPTGAMTLTGTIKLAASAKYTAEPPSVAWTLPKGPSRVSSATEPATRSCLSGTAACAAARRDDVSGMSELAQEVLRARVAIDLHPGSSQLVDRVRVGSGGGDLVELRREACSRRIGRGLAPWVVHLDDVDSVSQLQDALGAKVRTVAIERMRHICKTTHLVHQVHRVFRAQERRHAPRDEQADDLALERFRFLANDRELGSQARELQRAFDSVVVGEGDAAEPALAGTQNQRIKRCPAVV